MTSSGVYIHAQLIVPTLNTSVDVWLNDICQDGKYNFVPEFHGAKLLTAAEAQSVIDFFTKHAHENLALSHLHFHTEWEMKQLAENEMPRHIKELLKI